MKYRKQNGLQLNDHTQQLGSSITLPFRPERAEAANEGAGKNQSQIRASLKLRLAEMKLAGHPHATEAETTRSKLQEC